jgi:hypothetical protein
MLLRVVAFLVGLSLATEEGLVLQADISTTGEVYSVYGSVSGVFVITFKTNDKYYVNWGSPNNNIACELGDDILPLTAVFLDVWNVEDTLFVLNADGADVYLHSFQVSNTTSTCLVVEQWSDTDNTVVKGKPIYGFHLFQGTTEVLVSLVDSKRNWLFMKLQPSTTDSAATTVWTQSRSMLDVDAAAGDTTGSSSKAFPSHTYTGGSTGRIVLLDKTGKGNVTVEESLTV